MKRNTEGEWWHIKEGRKKISRKFTAEYFPDNNLKWSFFTSPRKHWAQKIEIPNRLFWHLWVGWRVTRLALESTWGIRRAQYGGVVEVWHVDLWSLSPSYLVLPSCSAFSPLGAKQLFTAKPFCCEIPVLEQLTVEWIHWIISHIIPFLL